MQENPILEKLRDIVTALNDRGDFAMADWVLMAKVRIAQLEMNVDSAPKLMPAEPVEWPTHDGEWQMEVFFSGETHTIGVMFDSRLATIMTRNDVCWSREKCAQWHARFLPIVLPTFPQRDVFEAREQ